MSLLVAVKSNVTNLKDGKHEDARGSWAKEFAGTDVRYFIGDALANFGKTFLQTQRDELALPTSDLEERDVSKAQMMCQYFLGKTYTHVLIIDIDSPYKPLGSILTSGYHRYDYSGYVPMGRIEAAETFPYVDPVTDEFYPTMYPWVEAQSGIFLSREAAAVIVNELPKEPRYEMFFSRVLGPEIFRAQIKAANIDLHQYSLLTAVAV